MEIVKKISRKNKLSVSELIRASLKGFNFSSIKRDVTMGLQMSVRLDAKTRKALRDTSRRNNVPAGKIVREAVIAYIRKGAR